MPRLVSVWKFGGSTHGSKEERAELAEGIFRPDGHTVSVSDLYFVGHYMKQLDTRRDSVKRIEPTGVFTHRGSFMRAEVIVKAIGFEVMEGNERMLGRSRMASNYFVDQGLVCVFEPHLASVAPAAAKA